MGSGQTAGGHALIFHGAFCAFIAASGDSPIRADVPVPAGGTAHFDVSRDTWVSAFPGKEDANLGGSARLKTKGIQEFSILDVDPPALRKVSPAVG